MKSKLSRASFTLSILGALALSLYPVFGPLDREFIPFMIVLTGYLLAYGAVGQAVHRVTQLKHPGQ